MPAKSLQPATIPLPSQHNVVRSILPLQQTRDSNLQWSSMTKVLPAS